MRERSAKEPTPTMATAIARGNDKTDVISECSKVQSARSQLEEQLEQHTQKQKCSNEAKRQPRCSHWVEGARVSRCHEASSEQIVADSTSWKKQVHKCHKWGDWSAEAMNKKPETAKFDNGCSVVLGCRGGVGVGMLRCRGNHLAT